MNSIFAGITIFILSIFMVAGGRRWIAWLPQDGTPTCRTDRAHPRPHRPGGRGLLPGGAAAGDDRRRQRVIVLKILGVPFAAPLALLVLLFDLLPVVGATIAAVLVALVTIFVNFPIALIVWVIFAVVYQQVENYVIQPQIQRRAVEIEPFTVLVAVLFGATLFGVLGALLAIPTAASIQIAVREWMAYRPRWHRRQRQARPALRAETPARDRLLVGK